MGYKKRALLGLTILGMISVFFACGRGKDYLYLTKPTPPKQVAMNAQIKGILRPQVDILWIMGNMPEHATQLALGVSSYIADFAARTKIQWKMGLIADDSATEPYLGFDTPFDYTNVNPVTTFVNAVGVCETENNSTEMMFKPIIDILTRYPNFLRKDATFGIVFVNDNHESSNLTSQQFLTQLSAITGGLDHVFMYGVYGATDLGCNPADDDEDWNYQGSTFNQAITAQHGFAFSLCNDDFGTSLSKITDDLVTHILHPQILLQGRPDPATIKVVYNGNAITPGLKGTGYWVYDSEANAIDFTDLSFASVDNASVSITFNQLD